MKRELHDIAVDVVEYLRDMDFYDYNETTESAVEETEELLQTQAGCLVIINALAEMGD